MKKYELGNGHSILVEKVERGIDSYKVTFMEDGKALFGSEYMNKDCIEFEYGVLI